MYSQGDEEAAIVEYFGTDRGCFLDVGAWDGVTFSNTLKLAELGWSGLLVEPDPFSFANLIKNYRARKLSGVMLHALIMPEPGITKFHSSCGDGVSTASESHRSKWQDAVPYHELFMPAITPRDLLARFGYDFQFLAMDVEGLNCPLLQCFPLSKMNELKLVCVEHDGNEKNVSEFCAAAGLTKRIFRNAENIILARE